jgi:hypothetical protein
MGEKPKIAGRVVGSLIFVTEAESYAAGKRRNRFRWKF